ncbi:MAG: hypothetical protein V4660_14010 [Pseudomonadota bacterium]
MDPRTFARVKVVSVSILMSLVLAACGGEKARDTEDPVAEVSLGVGSLQRSVSPINLASKSAAVGSKSNIPASSSPVIAFASSKSSKAATSTSPSSQVSKSIVNVVSNNQASINSAVIGKAADVLVLSSSAASSTALSSRAASSTALSSRAASSTALSSRATSSTALSSRATSSTALSSRAASSIALSSKSASSKQAGALGATIEWRQPAARKNGDYLELSEIGGYQIRYKAPTATTFSYITIEGNSTTKYVFDKSAIGLKFEIAVYDESGLYSDFVTIN